METSSKTVVCPFHRVFRRHFTVPFCDNLVSGVPACVVDNFYPDLDPFSFKNIDEYEEFMGRIKICCHFVRSDVYAPVKKSGCFFGGGSCVYPAVQGFGACSVDCPRFREGSS